MKVLVMSVIRWSRMRAYLLAFYGRKFLMYVARSA